MSDCGHDRHDDGWADGSCLGCLKEFFAASEASRARMADALRSAETALIVHEQERTDAVLDRIRQALSNSDAISWLESRLKEARADVVCAHCGKNAS